MEIGTEISQKIRSAIKAKLVDLGTYVDEELPDYIMVMVANKKSQEQMSDDLSLFLGASTQSFTTWLQTLLSKLQSITADGLNDNNKEKIEKSRTTGTEEKQKDKRAESLGIVEAEVLPMSRTEHAKSRSSSHSGSKSHHSKSKLPTTEHVKSRRKSTEKHAAPLVEQFTSTRWRESTADTVKTSPSVIKQTESITSVDEPRDRILSGNLLGIGDQVNARQDEPEVAVVQFSPALAVVTPVHSFHEPQQKVLEELKPVEASTKHEIPQPMKTGSSTIKLAAVQDTEEPEFSVRADTDEFSEEFNKEVAKTIKTEPVSPATKATSLTRPVTDVSSIALPLSTGGKKNIPKAVTSPMHQPIPVISQTKKNVGMRSEQKRTAVEMKRKPSSVVGNIIHKYTDEHEEEYDPHYPAVGSVASKIQITARKSSVPKRLQANRTLLLKAVSDAERSVTVKRQSPWSVVDTEPPQKAARLKDPGLSHKEPYRVTSGQTVCQKDEKLIVRPLQRTIHCVKVPSNAISQATGPARESNAYAADIPTMRSVGLPVTRKAGMSITRQHVLRLGNKIKKGSQMQLVSKSRRQDMLRSFLYTVENKSALLRMDQEHCELADIRDVRQVECGDSPSSRSEDAQDHMLTTDTDEEEVISIDKEEQVFLGDKEENEVIAADEVEQMIDCEQDGESGQSEESGGGKSDTNSEIEFIEGHGNTADPEITEILEEENETFDLEMEEGIESEGGVVEEYTTDSSPVTQQRPPTNIVHAIHRKKIQEKPLPMPVVTSPKFIVTLDGVDPSRFSQSSFGMQQQVLEEGTEDKAPKPPKKVATPKIQPFSINLVDSDEEEEEDDVTDIATSKKARPIERCKFWPACANGTNCSFHHPTMPCKTFPHCKFGDKCLYIHPNCKFDSRCTRKDCPFTHASKRSPVQTVVHKVVQVPLSTPVSVQTSSQPVQCRFYPNCHNMACPFVHPRPCRYGSSCMNKAQCSFYHSAIPAADKLKWSASKTLQISERFDVGSSEYLPSGLS